MTRKITRRGFIDQSAKSTAGLLLLPFARKALGNNALEPLAQSRVVVVKHDNALSGSAFNQQVVQAMMDSGITTFTGISDAGEAWKSIFPGITPSSIIGIKINCLFAAMSTHPPVATALINSLKQMVVDGSPFPENNFILWDNWGSNMRNAGFTINSSASGVRYIGTDGSYDSTSYKIDGGANQRLSKILTERINFLINFNVLKDHWTSGVSLSMKNHYGSIDNVDGSGMHDNYAELPISSINALQPIRDKQVLCICDAIKGTISGGPSAAPQVTPKSLIFAKDPVAHDYVGTQILKQYGCSATETNLTGMARHISAAASRYGLGTCDPGLIETIEVNNPTGVHSRSGEIQESSVMPSKLSLVQNYPNPFSRETTISYQLYEPSSIRIRITNVNGQLVRELFEGRQDPGDFHLAWDGNRSDGTHAPSGIFLCMVETELEHHSIMMRLIR